MKTTQKQNSSQTLRLLSRLCTFAAVVFAWVFFRAETGEQAIIMSISMMGFNGIGDLQIVDMVAFGWLTLLLCITWMLPNTLEWAGNLGPRLTIETRDEFIFHSSFKPSAIANPIIVAPAMASAIFIVALIVYLRGIDTQPFIYMFF